MNLSYTVKQKDKNKTINDILIDEFKISNRLRIKLIKNKKISYNNQIANTNICVQSGSIINVDLSEDEDNSNIVSTNMNLDILYEDEWFLVINKPAGIAIHPSNLHYSDSLSNGIKAYFDKIGLHKKIRPVNRLDLNTSGVVIFAKCEYIQEQFSKQMLNHIFQKEYLCIVDKNLKQPNGTVNLPIARKPNSIIERCINENGKHCITHYEVLKNFEGYSLVKCKLETGRTHQIRVHFSAIRPPSFR